MLNKAKQQLREVRASSINEVIGEREGRRKVILESRIELLTQNNWVFSSIELVQRWDWREWFDWEYFQYNFFRIVLLKIRI